MTLAQDQSRGLLLWPKAALLATLAIVVAITTPALCAEDSPEQKPNIVFILIDDLGWMDLHCQGNKLVDTPNIDRMALQGMRFTDAYAAAPVCSPTRASILTGKSPARLHLTTHLPGGFLPEGSNLLPAKILKHLPLQHVTIAERLGQAGYSTAFLGKWHVCGGGDAGKPFFPEHQGFDVNIAGCSFGGPPTYFDPYRIPTLKNRRPGEYLPDRLADEAVTFMQAKRDEPFLLFLWNYTVHWPMEAKPEMLEKYTRRGVGLGLKDVRYGAMIENMDAAVGRVLQGIDELKLTERTLVVFMSDNGGYMGVADNSPLRLGKGYVYEGGIRVPLIVRWPGVVKPGSTCHVPVISTDFYPTMLAAAGLAPDASTPADGESLMPLLRQSGKLKRREIFFHYPNYAWHKDNRLAGAVRQGDYKLIENFDDGSVELYNLAEDLSEKQDLAKKLPEKAAELTRKLQDWRKTSGALMPIRRTQ